MTLPPSTPVASTPLDVLTDTIQAAHGSRGDLRKSREQAQAALDALTEAGYVVLRRRLVERASYCVPNGYGEPTLRLYNELRAALSASTAHTDGAS